MSEYDGHIVEGHEGKHYDRANSEKYKRDVNEKVPYKICQGCEKVLPATAEYFHRDRYRKDGFLPKCKECKKIEVQKRKAKRKEKEKIGVLISEPIDDNEKLLNFAKNFLKFLESNPKISFNLHDTIREIQELFKLIQKNV